jgi:4-amino-4-deoxy-L-arabinose transferase-like glycosyltransferase
MYIFRGGAVAKGLRVALWDIDMAVISDHKARKGFADLGLAALTGVATASHLRAVLVLIAISLAAFLPGFLQIPPVDRDEARFAQATKQMIETGDYVDIRFQDEPRYKKPVGIYWLQAVVVNAAEAAGLPRARARIWLYRVPSLIGAMGAVALTYWAALAFVSRRAAFLAGLMMASSILLGVEARLAKTDALLLLTAVAAMGALARAYLAEQGERPTHVRPFVNAAIFWSAIGGGILLKGPVIVFVVGLAVLTLVAIDRSAHWLSRLQPAAGVLWALALVMPWFVAIFVRSGGSFFVDAIGEDMFAKVAGAQETHGMPPGFYFAAFWLTFFPGAMLAGLATPAVWRARGEPGCKFLLAWALPFWLVLELVPTKLPHYVLPLYPALAILIAGVIDGHALSRHRWLVRGTVWWFILSGVVALALVALQIAAGQRLGLFAWPFAGAAVVCSLFAWVLYRIDGAEVSLLRAAAASILLALAAYGAAFPSMPGLFPSVGLANYVRGANCPDPGVVTAGFHEPSLVFLAGTNVNPGTGSTAADFLVGGPCRFALVDSRQERAFVQRADALGLRYAPGPRIEGFNINGGTAVTIAIYRSERTP